MAQTAANNVDRIRAFLVLAATIGTIAFNWLAATGRIGGVTVGEVSDAYPTPITPADYAFTIWTLIYIGLSVFSIYQILPSNLERFRPVRSLYIFTCALNCAWIYFWLGGRVDVAFAILLALTVTLFFLNYQLRQAGSLADFWAVKAPFGIYFGWVTTATLVNFAVMLGYLDVQLSASVSTALGTALILLAAALGVIVRLKMTNYLYPLAIAWALGAIGVKQSGNTVIVVAAALGVVACLIAALSFVMKLPTREPGTTGPPTDE